MMGMENEVFFYFFWRIFLLFLGPENDGMLGITRLSDTHFLQTKTVYKVEIFRTFLKYIFKVLNDNDGTEDF